MNVMHFDHIYLQTLSYPPIPKEPLIAKKSPSYFDGLLLLFVFCDLLRIIRVACINKAEVVIYWIMGKCLFAIKVAFHTQ